MGKKVEIFTAGTYLCDEVVTRVESVICKNCDIIVYNLNEQSIVPGSEEKASFYNIQSIPAIVVDDKLQDMEILRNSKLI